MTWQEFKCKYLGWHDWSVWSESVNDRVFDYQMCRNPKCTYGKKPMLGSVGRKPW